jgi:nudix-type nucleoside diphosphatase (YffH/AdpP family)
LPDGRIVKREIEDHGSAVCVLPYDPVRRMAILVRQFRAPVFFSAQQEETLEAVAGILEETDPAACARREAHEEAGLALRSLEPVASAWTMPGISTERMFFYLAPYGLKDRVADGGGVAAEHECISVVEMTLADVAALSDTGHLVDLKTLVLAQALRLRHPDLFT